MTADPLVNSYSDGPVWEYFCLTYSAYLVLPRVSLCSMPVGWQRRFVALMKRAEAMLPPEGLGQVYEVRIRGKNGRYEADPLSDYRHHGGFKLRDAT